jgi:accessory gene regulator protein AgrB
MKKLLIYFFIVSLLLFVGCIFVIVDIDANVYIDLDGQIIYLPDAGLDAFLTSLDDAE